MRGRMKKKGGKERRQGKRRKEEGKKPSSFSYKLIVRFRSGPLLADLPPVPSSSSSSPTSTSTWPSRASKTTVYHFNRISCRKGPIYEAVWVVQEEVQSGRGTCQARERDIQLSRSLSVLVMRSSLRLMIPFTQTQHLLKKPKNS